MVSDVVVRRLWLACAGVLVCAAGLAVFWWGAYSSCYDGGGTLRGVVVYYQCVNPRAPSTVPYGDGDGLLTLRSCSALCDRRLSFVGRQNDIFNNASVLFNISNVTR